MNKKHIYTVITWPIKKILLLLLIGIRPLLGPANCRFIPSCGHYAVQQLKDEPLHKALVNIIKQLLRCSNPFW